MLNALFFVLGLAMIALANMGITFLYKKAGVAFGWFAGLQTKLGFKKFMALFSVAQAVVLGGFCLLDWFLGMIVAGVLGVFVYRFVIVPAKKKIAG